MRLFPPAEGAAAPRDGLPSFGWGFFSQGLSSITNLGLSVIAARVLGPNGLGIVAIGFGSYMALLLLQRALITDPLVVISAALPADERAHAARKALTTVVVLALGGAVLAAIAGVAVSGDVGQGLLIVAPWLPALVIQDYWRAVLFRDGQARAASANDGVWLLAMAIAAPLAWMSGSSWAVIGCWGIGGLVAALFGFVQTRITPAPLQNALRWWRRELWPLGGWLGANSVISSIAGYMLLFILAGLFGTKTLGGVRAVTTVFTPLSLIGAAIAFPGLPALARERALSDKRAVRLALRLGYVSIAVTAVYFAVLGLAGDSVITGIFGPSFGGFENLVWPVGAQQLIAAAAIGFALLLRAQRRGPAVLSSETSSWIAALGLASLLGAEYGVVAAMWGVAAGAVVGTTLSAVLVLRSGGRAAQPVGMLVEAATPAKTTS